MTTRLHVLCGRPDQLLVSIFAALLVLVTLVEPARGNDWRITGDLELDLRYTRFGQPEVDQERADSLLAGFGIAGFAGRKTIGYAMAFDIRFGAGMNGGFAYNVALHPLGVGVVLAHAVRFSTTIGIGTQGLTGHIPAALRWPVRATLHLELGRRLHLAGWAQATFISAADSRQSGSESTPFGDELSAGGYLRVGKGGREYGSSEWGNGYLVGAAYQEMLGDRQLMVIVGYGIGVTAEP